MNQAGKKSQIRIEVQIQIKELRLRCMRILAINVCPRDVCICFHLRRDSRSYKDKSQLKLLVYTQ